MGALGKDIQDELRPVHDTDLDDLADVAHLGGGEIRVHDHQVRVLLLDHAEQLVELALAQEGDRVRLGALLHYLGDDLGAGGGDQLTQLGEVRLAVCSLRVNGGNDGALSFFDDVHVSPFKRSAISDPLRQRHS